MVQKFKTEINVKFFSITEYVDAEGCFVPNSHCTVSQTHSSLCIAPLSPSEAEYDRISDGTSLQTDSLDCTDRKTLTKMSRNNNSVIYTMVRAGKVHGAGPNYGLISSVS